MQDNPAFRASTAKWLEDNCPMALRKVLPSSEWVHGGRKEAFINPFAKQWFCAMRDKGYLAPEWPVQFGGAGLTVNDAKILRNEMKKLNCQPALMSLGIHMMGPTIMEFGNEEQKLRLLPPIAKGDIRWCQGYSEPGAGSDLASLQCKAERVEGGFIVKGQKIWTSDANKSDFLFCLVRTDKTAPKHQGISVLLIDMESTGVTVKPIELISGSSHFCEVFLDDVFVPESNLLGEINQGWSIAKRMLQYERNMMGQRELGEPFDPSLVVLGKTYLGEQDGKIKDVVKRDQIAAYEMQLHAVNITTERVLEELRNGAPAVASSILKLATSETYKAKFELLLEVLGNRGLGWQGDEMLDADELRIAKEWAFSKVLSIGGGTTEIQLNIIAKQILQLPE